MYLARSFPLIKPASFHLPTLGHIIIERGGLGGADVYILLEMLPNWVVWFQSCFRMILWPEYFRRFAIYLFILFFILQETPLPYNKHN